MPTRLLIAGLCLLVLGVVFCRAGVTALRTRRWGGGAVRSLVGLLLLALAGLAAAIAVGLREYRSLTLEVLAATVTTQPLGPQRFRAMIVLPDKSRWISTRSWQWCCRFPCRKIPTNVRYASST